MLTCNNAIWVYWKSKARTNTKVLDAKLALCLYKYQLMTKICEYNFHTYHVIMYEKNENVALRKFGPIWYFNTVRDSVQSSLAWSSNSNICIQYLYMCIWVNVDSLACLDVHLSLCVYVDMWCMYICVCLNFAIFVLIFIITSNYREIVIVTVF